MSNDNISLTVPMTSIALNAAAKMLQELATDELSTKTVIAHGTTTTACDDQFVPEPKKVLTEADALADLNGEPRPYNPSPEATAMQEQDAKAVFAPPPPVEKDTTGPEDSLDANGLPWDARIHAATRTKDAKGNWKYLRGVDRDVLVPEVEAELRAMMAGPTLEDFNVMEIAAAATAVPTPLAPPAATDVTPSTSVTTFAQLVTGITSNNIDELRVNAVLANVGVTNLALLGAKPDLIPAVAGHLGL